MTTLGQSTTLPHDVDAEQVVLGSMLATPALISDVCGLLAATDLYEPRHATIFEHLIWLSDENKPVELASLLARLTDQGDLHKVGGREYIVHLWRKSSPQSAMYYAELLMEKARKRNLIEMHLHGLRQAQDGTGVPLPALMADTYTALDTISEERGSHDVVRAASALDSTFDRIEELGKSEGGVTGVPTGFYELDRLTYGLHPGQMVTVAARPGAGKSTLGLDMVRSASIRHGIPSLIFSLEMSVEEIMMRLLSAEAMVELNHIRSGRVTDDGWKRLARKQEAITKAPLFINDDAGITMQGIRQHARRVQQRHGLGLVVIDYLQLMSSGQRVESRQQEVSQFSRGIKLLAKELKVPVVAMSQLNRGAENRTDNRPKISDLRESGSIEQDSDVVMLIHREEMYDPETPRVGEADIILAKQRSAPQGVAVLGWQGAFSRFADMTRQEEPA